MAKSKRSFSRRKGIQSKKSSMKSLVKRTVRSYLKPEVKRVVKSQTEVSLNTLSQTPYALSFSAIAQGLDDYQRVGNKIKAIGLNFQGVLCNNGSSPNLVRILLINQQNPETDITSTSTNIFDTNTITSIATLTGIGTMYAPINKDKYSVLYNRVFKLAPTGAADGSNIVQFRKFFKLNKQISYEGNSAGDCSRNNIRLIAFSAEAPNDPGVGQVVEFTAYGSLFFTDA